MRDRLEILPIRGIGEVGPDSDLAELITTAAPWLRDGDVLVVTSKIISKAEGQLVDVPTAGPEREAAREELLVAETARPVARRGHTRIVQTHHGFVMASAGIDASNVERSRLVLLPKDPDASARGLRAALRERYGLDVAVIVSDTMGRPWRNGLTDVALGAAGIDPIRDYRGEYDSYGNEMHVTQVAVVDELSAAGDLVKGKFDQVPVAVVRGYLPAGGSDGVGASGASGGPRASGRFGASGGVDGLGGLGATGDGPGDLGDLGDGPGATVLVREAQYDLFSMGTAEARAAGLKLAATLGDTAVFGEDTVDLQTVARAMASVTVAPTTIAELAESTQGLAVRCRIEAPTPEALVALGIDVHRIRCALAAEGLASAWRPSDGLIDIGRPA